MDKLSNIFAKVVDITSTSLDRRIASYRQRTGDSHGQDWHGRWQRFERQKQLSDRRTVIVASIPSEQIGALKQRRVFSTRFDRTSNQRVRELSPNRFVKLERIFRERVFDRFGRNGRNNHRNWDRDRSNRGNGRWNGNNQWGRRNSIYDDSDDDWSFQRQRWNDDVNRLDRRNSADYDDWNRGQNWSNRRNDGNRIGRRNYADCDDRNGGQSWSNRRNDRWNVHNRLGRRNSADYDDRNRRQCWGNRRNDQWNDVGNRLGRRNFAGYDNRSWGDRRNDRWNGGNRWGRRHSADYDDRNRGQNRGNDVGNRLGRRNSANCPWNRRQWSDDERCISLESLKRQLDEELDEYMSKRARIS